MTNSVSNQDLVTQLHMKGLQVEDILKQRDINPLYVRSIITTFVFEQLSMNKGRLPYAEKDGLHILDMFRDGKISDPLLVTLVKREIDSMNLLGESAFHLKWNKWGECFNQDVGTTGWPNNPNSKIQRIFRLYKQGVHTSDIASQEEIPLKYVKAKISNFVFTDLLKNNGRLPHVEINGMHILDMMKEDKISDPYLVIILKRIRDMNGSLYLKWDKWG
jgi:hypothetical protein